jgi:hypothetical protein
VGAWLGVQSVRAPDGDYVDPVPGDVTGPGVPMALVGVAFDTFPPTASARSPMDASTEVIQVTSLWKRFGDLLVGSVPLAMVLVGAGPAGALRRRVKDGEPVDAAAVDQRWVGVPLGVSTVIGLVVGAVALNVQHWLAKGTALSSLHSRYGLAMVALLLGGLAMLADRYRPTRWALWGFVGVGLVVALVGAL